LKCLEEEIHNFYSYNINIIIYYNLMAKDIELLKKKIIYKSSYRGTKELDIILRSFVKKYINNLPIKDLKDLFDFLNNNDEDIFKFKQGLKENNKIKNNNISNLFKNFSL
tara:strand:- start:54 stop:383 length:330 start_codon:yes stop_codon:yes gene_type:complete